MLTQCQQCKKTYSTSVEDLCLTDKELLCPNCEEMLGRLRRLGNDFIVLGEHKRKGRSSVLLWSMGAIACLLLLSAQIYFFEKDRLSQNPKARPFLQNVCQRLNCTLPEYRKLDDFEVMYGAFKLTEDHHYEFQAVISNQAKFRQRYPDIQLNLLSFSGENFARRVFVPKEYLGGNAEEFIEAGKTVEISMKIAAPAQKVGGYTFELI